MAGFVVRLSHRRILRRNAIGMAGRQELDRTAGDYGSSVRNDFRSDAKGGSAEMKEASEMVG